MNSITYKGMEVIKHITSAITRAKTIDEAINEGISIIINECNVDYAVVWTEDVKGDSVLHPSYWICPIDLSIKEHKNNEGSVGRVYKTQIPERYLTYHKGDDTETDKDFGELNIGSMICVPLSSKSKKLGCIQFINSRENDCITEEEADTFEMLVTLIAIYVDSDISFSRDLQKETPIIEVRGIRKKYINGDETTQVLKGMNLNVYEGEFLVLLGESGCGKSTFMNIIGGLEKADEGEILFMGKDLFDASEEELTEYRRKNLGFIFQSYNLMPNLNAKENLDLITEISDESIDSGKALEMVGLGDRQDNYPSQLSGGQQQRVSIARAIAKKPKIIMADEPTAALDYETSIAVLSVLEEIHKSGTTLIMVTHNEEIAKMADRVIKMRNGRMYEAKRNYFPATAKELIW